MNPYLILLPIIVLLNLSYLYYWLVVIYARAHKHIDKSPVSNAEIKALAAGTFAEGKHPYRFTIQITTKGGSLKVVLRGIRYALQAVRKYPALENLLIVEVITEQASEVEIINREFNRADIPVTAYCLPADYQTPKRTQLKARALHYMVELHRANPRDAYIVHYDEESVFTPDNLARLVRNLLTNPVGISEGTISYALDWQEAHPMCRTMESNRPFGCHECYVVMTHPVPLHLHGSNLVIQERLENEIGWDIGQYRDNPLIAEDLVFGLMAYIAYGKKAFGWHGAEMIEQPPFTLRAAYKQRERWVMGALQGVAHVSDLPGWEQLSWYDRFKIKVVIRLRVFTYGVGMPVSFISLLTWLFIGAAGLLMWALGDPTPIHFTWLAVPGLVMWLGATQIGLAQNLSYTRMSRWAKLWEHLTVLVRTPFAGLYDTTGPAVAIFKWCTGTKGIKWNPTPKAVGQEIER
jgi:cellulose synthase/poly-beta-1,6-N-acetylglucosamine synthase-like glycosyltransferase